MWQHENLNYAEPRQELFRGMMARTRSTLTGSPWWLRSLQGFITKWRGEMLADAKRRVTPAPVKPKLKLWSNNEVTICWLGHATVLINFYGINILTDPALNNRIGFSLGFLTAGPKRYVASALSFAELPPIDVVLLSHAHMDHMDLPTLRRFPKSTFTVTAKRTSDILRRTRLGPIVELGWNQRTTFHSPRGDLEITAFEVKHWGQRWPREMERGYNGYLLRREGRAILFGGDTASTPAFSELGSRGGLDVAIMPIGAYQPWIWNHCTPEQAIEMANQAGARYLVPIHHQSFRLSDEPMMEPIERFTEALQREPKRLALRKVGESFICPVR